MVNSIKDFITRWQEEAGNTLKVISYLSNDSLNKSLPGTRSLGRLANHIIETTYELPHKLGLPIPEEFITYNTVADLTAAYQRASERFVEALEESWNDETLKGETPMYGDVWNNGVSLYYLAAHQTHHRAQMTTIMRASGLRVPGIYGPSQEEWKEMNMAPLV